MTFNDNACIRYLMKEMDPSEELLFEKKMMEDEDLLIEVECLRKIHNKISDAPLLSPPDEISDSIMQQASEYSERKRFPVSQSYLFYSAAATVLVCLFAGLFLIANNNTSQTDEIRQAVSGSSMPGIEFQIRSSSSGVSPWIDNDEVLDFYDRFETGQASSYDSIYQNSYQRLQQPRQFNQDNNRSRDIHLTGSGN